MGIMESFTNKVVLSFVSLFMLSGCFPSFSPQKRVRCHINVKKCSFVLIDYIGTLYSEFPSEIYLVGDNDSVLVFKGYKIKKMNVNSDTLTIYLKGKILFQHYKIKDYYLLSSSYQ